MNPARRTLFRWTAAALATVSGLRARAEAGQACGTVVAVSGAAFVEAQGRSSPLKLGDPVAVGATIAVPAPGKLKLRMVDGSIVSFAPGTRVTVADYKTAPDGSRQTAILSLGEGLLRSVVSPVPHPSTYEVSTAVGVAAVRSTDWLIEAQPGSAQVGVLSGAVNLTSRATGRSVTIPARWGARLEAGRDPVPARVWSPQEFAAVIARTDLP